MPRPFENDEYCPNCGQYTAGESACPNCGAILKNNEENELEGFHEDEGDVNDLDEEV